MNVSYDAHRPTATEAVPVFWGSSYIFQLHLPNFSLSEGRKLCCRCFQGERGWFILPPSSSELSFIVFPLFSCLCLFLPTCPDFSALIFSVLLHKSLHVLGHTELHPFLYHSVVSNCYQLCLSSFAEFSFYFLRKPFPIFDFTFPLNPFLLFCACFSICCSVSNTLQLFVYIHVP